MKKKLIVLMTLLCTSCMPAFATNWINFAHAPNGANLYVDVDSINKTSNNTGTVWVKQVTPDGRAAALKMAINRSLKTSALMAYIFYDANGNIVSQQSRDTLDYSRIVPNSPAAFAYQAIWPY